MFDWPRSPGRGAKSWVDLIRTATTSHGLVEPDRSIAGLLGAVGNGIIDSLVITSVRTNAPHGCLMKPSFDTLYSDLRARMIRVAYLSVGSVAIAEEIVQEAFLRLHRHFDRVENPSGFLRTTVVNLCITWRGRAAMEADRLAGLHQPGPTGDPSVDETWDVLARLRPERRVVLVLRYYEDLSHEEIARIIGCPVATVHTRVWRGLRDLRKELEA
jgi:DNA-directed RNA polymerase specialized sigma24 family protein